MSLTIVGRADELAKRILKRIFKDKKIDALNNYEQAMEIYKYLIQNIFFDHDYYSLSNKEHREDNRDIKEQVYNVFKEYKGTGSSITQAYKILLDQLDISSLAVIVEDDGDYNQILMVKRGNDWSFDDVTRSILLPAEGLDNFDYDNDRLSLIGQRVFGVMGDEAYDSILKRSKGNKKNYGLERISEGIDLYFLPDNIKSFKKNLEIENNSINKSM